MNKPPNTRKNSGALSVNCNNKRPSKSSTQTNRLANGRTSARCLLTIKMLILNFKAQFAQLDGFANWGEIRDWFSETHGLPFSGLLIEW